MACTCAFSITGQCVFYHHCEPVITRLHPEVAIDREQVHRFTERAREIDDQARTFIRENPTTTVIVAAALGFALGRLLRR